MSLTNITIRPKHLTRKLGFLTKRSLAACAVALVAHLSAGSAHAVITTISGSWSGAPFSNSASVTMTVDIDLDNFSFDLGSPGAHAWWYGSGSFSNMTVLVTGSATPAYNGIFTGTAFNWVRLFSSAATPELALSALNYADLGNGGPADDGRTPSDSGGGNLQLGSGLGGGEFVASLGVSAIPEPGAISMLAISSVAVCIRRRRILRFENTQH